MTMTSSNRYFYIEEEIEVKPSAELIPDEYEHFTESKQKILLYTFTQNTLIDKESEAKFLKTVESYGYRITNQHNLDKDNLKEVLEKIAKNCTNDVAGIILFFSGKTKKENSILLSEIKENCITIQDIWLLFNSHTCPLLKNKPKIFIFDLMVKPSLIQTDSTRRMVHPGYDTPAEADILVICNKVEEESDFMYQFCENIKEYGETENIITLASCVDGVSSPIIISTLTRNFYFSPSNFRGNYRIIEKHHVDIKTEIDSLKDTVIRQITEKKKKPSIFNSFKLVRKLKDEDNSSEPAKSSKTKKPTDASGTNNSNLSTSKPAPPATQLRRSSGPSTQRTRFLSQTESDSANSNTKKKNESKKQIWKP